MLWLSNIFLPFLFFTVLLFITTVLSIPNSVVESIILKIEERRYILAYPIRISDIIFWDRKSCLTDVILPRLSREGCTLVVLELTRLYRQVTSLVC